MLLWVYKNFMVRFSLKIKEAARCIAKAIKDLVEKEPADDLFIEKIIAEAKSKENNEKSHQLNKTRI